MPIPVNATAIMCLYPKLILNRKYLPNEKNAGTPQQIKDERTRYVPIGCGKCMECLKQKARQWQVRLHEELREGGNILFVTLSFSNKDLINLQNTVIKKRKKTIKKLNKLSDNKYKGVYKPLDGYRLDNETAKWATRKFLERWRKKFGKSIKHWFVTELGQTNTERLHIHGLIWTKQEPDLIQRIWKYGNLWVGSYVNEATINYIIKYVHKQDVKHKHYVPIVLTSPGIGKNYLKRNDSNRNIYKGKDTNELYTTRNGIKLPLPIYYRNKLFTDDEKEELWLNLLDKEIRYVNGIKVDVSKNDNDYNKLLRQHRILNVQFGFPDMENEENDKEYEKNLRNLKRLQIIHKLKIDSLTKNKQDDKP